jgi:hypothetical protein
MKRRKGVRNEMVGYEIKNMNAYSNNEKRIGERRTEN